MIFLYDCALYIYTAVIHLAALLGNEKARLWVNGRRAIFNTIEAKLGENQGKNRKTIWFHVSSLGEFEQGRPIIEALKKEEAKFKTSLRDTKPSDAHATDEAVKRQTSNAKLQIVLTFFSPSGYEIRKNYPLADHIFYLPMDSSRHARRFLDLVKPDVAVFVKYEFWFHYLTQLQKRHTPTLLVSAIFRAKQFANVNPYAPLLVRILRNFTKIFLQDTPSVALLKKHDLNNFVVSGDTRVDRVAAIAAEGKSLEWIEKFVQNAPVFVGGSTWEADEKRILSIFSNPKFNDWRFIFAPHDISPSNINRLEQLLPEKTVRYSEFEKNKVQDERYTEGAIFNKSTPRILIIDNVGMLSTLYKYGRVAYIGGGFGAGIHNTLEPIAHGLPVLFGPKYEKFTEATRLVATGGGFVVDDNQSVEIIMENLLNLNNYDQAAKAAKAYIQQNRGATAQVLTELKRILAV